MLPTTTAILLASLVVVYLTTRVARAENQPCQEIPTETHFKVEDVEGTWFPTDIVLHRTDLKINGVPLTSQCPVVTFSVPNRNKNALLMVWNSTEGELEYRFTRPTKGGVRGQWQSTNEQQGSMATDDYKSFGGLIRLIRLDGDYAFFTFCSKRNRILSTVAFSRNGEMPRETFDEVLESLDQKRAKEFHIEPCGEDEDASAQLVVPSFFLAVLPTVVTWFGL